MFDSTICLCFLEKKTQGRNQKSILLKDKKSVWFSREKKAYIFLLKMRTTH